MVARVDGPQRVAHWQAALYVRLSFEVVGIRSKGFPPAAREHCPGRIVHHLSRGALGAVHFPDRLLCEDGVEARAVAPHRGDMAGRSNPESVAETHRRLQAERRGPQPRQSPRERAEIRVRAGPHQQAFAIPLGRGALEVVELLAIPKRRKAARLDGGVGSTVHSRD